MSVPEKVPTSRMPPFSTAAISTATAAPRGPPAGPPPGSRATICQTRKARKRTASTVNGRAFFAQSRFFSFFQSILGKANLTIR